MSDSSMKYHVRFYAKNPGGAYDPAHLPQFEIEEQASAPTIMPGDVVFAWSTSGTYAEGRHHYFKVVERAFRFDQTPDHTAVFVFVLVEEIKESWTASFD